MVLTALRGATGFLTRIPVGRDREAWHAFQRSPIVFPLAGYLIGTLLVVPLVLPVPAPTAAVLFVGSVYVVTGINHADGLADFGDAAVVHGDPETRRAVLTDTTVGVGAVLMLALGLLALALAGMVLATVPMQIVLLVIAAEVGAKLGMAMIACLGTAWHEGLGAGLTSHARPRALALPALVALPAGALTAPHPAATVALLGAVLSAGAVFHWARTHLGGVNGDVFGASNEIARVIGLHAGVIAWTLW